MTNSAAVDFYSAIRKDTAVIAHLAAATSEEGLFERIREEGAKRGLALSDADIRHGFDHIDEVIRRSAGAGELTDKELEIVSGGSVYDAFVPKGNRGAAGRKWGSFEIDSHNKMHYFNAAGCETSKEEYTKMNA